VKRLAIAFVAALACGSEELLPERELLAPGVVTVASHAGRVRDEPAPTAGAPARRRLAFVGDVSPAWMVAHHLRALRRGGAVPAGVGPGYPFAGVQARLGDADLVVGNLECVLSEKGAPATRHNPYRCPPDVSVPVLRSAGFDLLSVANNHAFDYGEHAFADMVARLETAGLGPFGGEGIVGRPQAARVHDLGGVRVGLLGYLALPAPPFADVRAARARADVVVAFMHWGNEGEPSPLAVQRAVARGLVDAGADLVVGAHAHVVQPVEWRAGKLIAYGLGNFVFSGLADAPAHRTGAVLEVELDGARIAAHRLLEIRIDAHGAPRWRRNPDAAAPLEPP
jgi:poly-gamma-glutamate synthesis protein (capsule biosynthesis protein)